MISDDAVKLHLSSLAGSLKGLHVVRENVLALAVVAPSAVEPDASFPERMGKSGEKGAM
jgi:hypothetical protein